MSGGAATADDGARRGPFRRLWAPVPLHLSGTSR